jgi:hypothetical protein
MEGMSATRSERNIQVIPYGLVEVGRSGSENPVDSDLDVGVDLKWAVTPALALDLTYNTNFAQVEADDRQINLTRFSLFFPEKREFFLENAQLFNFGILREAQVFFSRRIGLERGEQVPVLGGARLSGQAPSIWGSCRFRPTAGSRHPAPIGARLGCAGSSAADPTWEESSPRCTPTPRAIEPLVPMP